METILHIDTVSDYYHLLGQEMLHPLIGMIDFSRLTEHVEQREQDIKALTFGLYVVFFKEDKHCNIRYGRNYYDYQAGTLVFFGPGQVIKIDFDDTPAVPKGYALLFHPDLIRGTSLAKNINDYSFFSYDVHEALHVSAE